MTAPSVALITVTYNSARDLEQFWADRGHVGYEWIVVDNASDDSSADIARELGARVHVMEENRGFSAANNAGVATSDAEVLIFCNPDVAVTPEGVDTLARRITEEGGVWAPQLLNTDSTPQENGRGAPFLWSKVKHLLRIDDPAYARIADNGEIVEVVWAMGAAVGMRRQDFLAIGGWDDGFFIYYEDADICIRALSAGMPVRVDGGVRWFHGWARETGRGFSLRAWKFEFRAAWRFYRKYPHCILGRGKQARALRAVGALS